jgi:hypothetical protein
MREEMPLSFTRIARALLWMGAALSLTACNNNSNRAVTVPVGVDTGVTLTTSGSETSLLTGGTLGLGAVVTNASNAAGVTWSLTGVGSLSAETPTTATYNAPSGTGSQIVTGASTALITATSVANPTQVASVALIVLGTPLIDPTTLFPANVNVAYQAPVSASGGDAPFTWVVLSGTLPAGLALNGSTSGSTYIEGTPTTTGNFSFTLQATDSLSRVATVALTMAVNPQAACVLQGNYTLLFTGTRGNGMATHAASIQISSTGTVTGEQDYKDPNRTTAAEILTSGNCVNRETNTGVLTLEAPSGEIVYNFAATLPGADQKIHSAGLQLIHSGSDSGSGQLDMQDFTGVTAGTAPSGDYAFGLLGVTPAALRFGTAGRFTSAAGTLSAGVIDSNATPSPLTETPLAGTLAPPDANGRGTLTLLAGGQTTTLAYYFINASKMFLIDIDPTTSGGTTRLAGQMTAQVGNAGASAFDGNALASPSIVSLFGTNGTSEPLTNMSLGRLSNGNATAGTVDVLLDNSNQDVDTQDETFTTQSYAIATNGRGTLSLANTTGARSFAFYLDGTADGYLVEHTSGTNSAGFLEAQSQGPYEYANSSGPFPATLANGFVSYTAYPMSSGPITLNSLLYLNYDSMSSNFVNGSFAIDPTIGRGLGTVTESGVGTNSASLYIVSPTRMEMLRFGTRAIDGTIETMIQN